MKQQMKHRMSEEARKVADSLRQKGISRIGAFIEESGRAQVHLTRNDILSFLDAGPYGGPFYTPDNVAQFMASLGMSHHPDTILDPVCGVGNLLSYCSDAGTLVGVDIDNSLTPATSIVCPRADLYHADFLRTDRDRSFDLVVADLPFGMRDPSTKVPLEQRILLKSLDCLNPDGLLVALIPPSMLWSANASAFREIVLREYCLEAVIALWPGASLGTGIVPAVIVIGKRRRDHPVMIAVASGTEDLLAIAAQFASGKPEVTVGIRELVQEWNPSRLLAARSEERDGLAYARIGDLADVLAGAYLPKNWLLDRGGFLVFKRRHVHDGRLAPQLDQAEYIADESAHLKEQAIARVGDIIVSLRYTPGKVYSVGTNDPPCIVPSGFAIVRSRESGGYIRAFLASSRNQDLLVDKARARAKGTVIPGLSVSGLADIRIPVLLTDSLRDFDADELVKKTPEDCAAFADRWIAMDQNFARKADRLTYSDMDDTRFTGGMESMVHDVQLTSIRAFPSGVESEGTTVLKLDMAGMFLDYFRPMLQKAVNEACQEIVRRFDAYYADEKRDRADEKRAHADMVEHLQRIGSSTTLIPQILDKAIRIESQLETLRYDFASVKESDRELEEKIALLGIKLDNAASTLQDQPDKLADYYELCARTVPHWERLEQLSQLSMTMAEYLLSTFERLSEPDYSPCVLEYCKSLENELLTKIFMGFVREFKKPSVCKSMLPIITSDASANGPTTQFSGALLKYVKGYDSFRFTLGQMQHELQDAGDEQKVASNALLSSFRLYLNDRTFSNRILDPEHLKEVGQIVNGLRNPCAHPTQLNRRKALTAKERIPAQIVWVVESVRDVSLGGE